MGSTSSPTLRWHQTSTEGVALCIEPARCAAAQQLAWADLQPSRRAREGQLPAVEPLGLCNTARQSHSGRKQRAAQLSGLRPACAALQQLHRGLSLPKPQLPSVNERLPVWAIVPLPCSSPAILSGEGPSHAPCTSFLGKQPLLRS